MNPADAILDIISGAALPKSGQSVDVAAAWRSQEAGLSAQHNAGQHENDALAAVVSLHDNDRSTMDSTTLLGGDASIEKVRS